MKGKMVFCKNQIGYLKRFVDGLIDDKYVKERVFPILLQT